VVVVGVDRPGPRPAGCGVPEIVTVVVVVDDVVTGYFVW
jgi:hypothetical protein